MLHYPIERSEVSSNTSLYGAAFLAGLGSKIWNDVEDLKRFRKNVQTFYPDRPIVNISNEDNNKNHIYNPNHFSEWKIALQRHINWYKPL